MISKARLTDWCRSPPQHVALLCFLEYQHQLVDTVDLVLDTLDQRPKGIGNVVDQGVRDPIRCDRDVIFEMLDSPADVLRMRRAAEVELRMSVSKAPCGSMNGQVIGDSPIRSPP